MSGRTLILIGLLGLMAPAAAAQAYGFTRDTNPPFSTLDLQRNGAVAYDPLTAPFRTQDPNSQDARAQAAADGLGFKLQLPMAMQVIRPLSIAPPRQLLVTPTAPEPDARLAEFDKRRADLMKQMRECRKSGQYRQVARLMRQLEEVRQAKLQYVASVGTRVTPEKPEAAKPELPLLDAPKAPEVEPLPVPKLRKQ